MASRKKAAPADGAQTAGDLESSWPFPTTSSKARAAKNLLPLEPDRQHDDDTGDNTAAPPAMAAERVRIESIDLYVDPAKNLVQRLALEQLLESPFNPRTNYDPRALQELADTVRHVGVMQPLLVRPIAMPEGWAIQRGAETMQPYEIVFGHRRYRAARLAGVPDVPAIVRELTQGVVDSGYGNEKPQTLLALAKEFGVDIAEVRKDVVAKVANTQTQDLLNTEPADEEEAEEA